MPSLKNSGKWTSWLSLSLTIVIIAIAFTGCTKVVDVKRNCSKCDGDGVIEHWFSEDDKCGTCKGSGKVDAKNEQVSWEKTILLLLAVSAIVATPYGIKKQIEKKQSEKAAIEKRIQDSEKVAYAKKQLELFCNWLTLIMIIDSNIWMNEDYDSFFACMRLACIKKEYRIDLFGVQFDEMANIKKACSYGEVRNKRARLAINRIEDFQKEKLLNIVPVTLDAKRGAYADPVIVKVLATKSREGKECTLFSNDKELRVRARQVLADYSEADSSIIEIENYIGTFQSILEGYRLMADNE